MPSPKKKVKVEVKKDGGEEGRPKVEMKLEEETEGVVAVKAEDDGLLLVEERSVKTETEEVDVKVKAS